MLLNHQISDMKKILLTLCLGTFVTMFAMANNADLFSYNADEINQELAQLQSLEDYVSANPGITLTNLQAENNSLISDLNLDMINFGSLSLSGEPPLGIPSFLWGCVFTVVGVAVVYFVTDQDMDETKKAILGCVVSGAVYVLWWVFWVLVFGNSLFWY